MSPDSTLRIKIGDACGLTCTFCHNEGTPVAQDNFGRRPGNFLAAGPSGRVSIYSTSNRASFVPARMPADETFSDALAAMSRALGFTEVHLTGGEPTLHPEVDGLTRLAVEAGFTVGMTSNGENGAAALPSCAAAGLDRVNFSIFGTTAGELAEVQDARFRSPARAGRKIAALKESIRACSEASVRATANIVVPDYGHAARVHRLLDEYSPNLSVRLLNSLDHGSSSIEAIERILRERGAVPVARYITAGASGTRTAYQLPDKRRVFFKQIRPVRLPDTCKGCPFNNGSDCQEGYYGVRLYYDNRGRYQVGVCIQRMDLCLPIEEFLASSLVGEIKALRDSEWDRLTARRAG
ncbi:radical SAM protein [Amycolatopsis sp. PS_44_ISF1]|uniref:radical SAM protein n=1 Tax=Amycolatopsis sp. PS_44_ISF1 TaxID=2974917 RepID=UPI0028DE2264|nr:radical SAM protein [Amycolatopsis sp. PS_44_ISF1]MDT8910924.1 radical SAM protein [Amycolatopsis sp. PS_44_ISF1]